MHSQVGNYSSSWSEAAFLAVNTNPLLIGEPPHLLESCPGHKSRQPDRDPPLLAKAQHPIFVRSPGVELARVAQCQGVVTTQRNLRHPSQFYLQCQGEAWPSGD